MIHKASTGGPWLAVALVAVTLLTASCKDRKAGPLDDPKVRKAVAEAARQQKAAGQNVRATVHRAWVYAGTAWYKPVEGLRLVAVDVGLKGYGEEFDLDDLDIVDAATGENYGSDPDISLLKPSGAALDDEKNWPKPPGPIRVLLVYQLPMTVRSVKLSYWGRELTASARMVEASGPKFK